MEESIQVKLTIRPGDSSQSHAISFDDDRVSLGRSSSCDIQLPFPVVSSHHLSFVRSDGSYRVRDEGSTNGTKLDGKMLEPGHFAGLRNGSTIQIVDLVVDITIRKPTAAVEDFTLAQTGTLARKMLGEALDAGGEDLAFFEIMNGQNQGERLKLPDDLDSSFIGSALDCILQVPGTEVADRALQVSCEADGFLITPVDGVDSWHNGSQLEEPAFLSSGDRVAFNQRSLLFHDPLESQLQELDGLSGSKRTSAADAATEDATGSAQNTDQAEAIETDTAPESTGQSAPDADTDPADASPTSTGTDVAVDAPTPSQTGQQVGQQNAATDDDPQPPTDDTTPSSRGWGLLEIFLLLLTLVFIVAVTLVLLVTFEII